MGPLSRKANYPSGAPLHRHVHRFIRLNPEFGRCRNQAIKKLRYICNSYDFDSLMSCLRFLKGRLNNAKFPPCMGKIEGPFNPHLFSFDYPPSSWYSSVSRLERGGGMSNKCPKCEFDNPDDTIYCGIAPRRSRHPPRIPSS